MEEPQPRQWTEWCLQVRYVRIWQLIVLSRSLPESVGFFFCSLRGCKCVITRTRKRSYSLLLFVYDSNRIFWVSLRLSLTVIDAACALRYPSTVRPERTVQNEKEGNSNRKIWFWKCQPKVLRNGLQKKTKSVKCVDITDNGSIIITVTATEYFDSAPHLKSK